MKTILHRIWDNLEEFFLLPSLTIMVVVVFAQVVARYIFGTSIAWSEELARYLFVCSTWIGVSYSAKRGTHLRITFVRDMLKGNKYKILELFVVLVWIVFALFMINQGITLTQTIAQFGQRSAAMQAPMWIFYATVPIGLGLMVIRLLHRTALEYLPDINKILKRGDES